MKNKRKQYLINQFQLRDLEKCSKDNIFKIIEPQGLKPVQQSENFLFHMTFKITNSTQVDDRPNELNEIITIKTGTGSTADEKEKLRRVLDEGVIYGGRPSSAIALRIWKVEVDGRPNWDLFNY